MFCFWGILVSENYPNWLCSVCSVCKICAFSQLKPEAAYFIVTIFKFHCFTMFQLFPFRALSLSLYGLHTLFRIHFTISSNFWIQPKLHKSRMPNAEKNKHECHVNRSISAIRQTIKTKTKNLFTKFECGTRLKPARWSGNQAPNTNHSFEYHVHHEPFTVSTVRMSHQ